MILIQAGQGRTQHTWAKKDRRWAHSLVKEWLTLDPENILYSTIAPEKLKINEIFFKVNEKSWISRKYLENVLFAKIAIYANFFEVLTNLQSIYDHQTHVHLCGHRGSDMADADGVGERGREIDAYASNWVV